MTPRREPDWREQYLHVERSSMQLRKDLVAAFDQIHELKCDRRNLKNWLKLLGVIVTVEGAVIGWFATSLLDCIQAAHRMTAALLH